MPRHDFQHQSQDQRQSISEALAKAGLGQVKEEEAELSFLIGCPEPKHSPQTD